MSSNNHAFSVAKTTVSMAIALGICACTVVLKKYQGGVTHELFGMGAPVDEAKQAVAFSAARLQRDVAR